ncbi:unnamed protein product, partial [Mesorhabditis belari]|uniref:Uncharacterized protein n=1 Tax=Mesorhabditis belari TaxID=2138241 RepID=A0AAF3EEM2_9BILA
MSFKFVSPFILLIWGWSVGLSIYIIGWVDVTFMYKGSNYSIAYATVQPNALLNTYASKCIPGFLFATIFLYLSFFVILYLQNTLSKNAQLKAKVIRSVLAAMLQNFVPASSAGSVYLIAESLWSRKNAEWSANQWKSLKYHINSYK